MRAAIVCKSLFGKAHTVMAEGGIAASMGNVNAKDNWQVHFRDTMRGGKFLNNPRMAELHAKEAPAAGLGAGDLRRAVRPHARGQDQPAQLRRPRVPAAGPRRRPHRPGADPHPAAEDRLAAAGRRARARRPRRPGSRSSPSARSPSCCTTATGAIAGAFGYWRESGRFVLFEAPAVVLATGGIGKSFKVTSNSWEYTGDGHALALRAGATLINMEFIQFHPTGMVWPPSVKGILVTESVRGDGGVLRNSEGKRFMFDYVPDVFRTQYADTEEEADRWYTDPDNNKRPPELLPRDEVARAINTEVKEGRGSPHGGVFLDVVDPAAGRARSSSGCRRCTTSSRSWPTSTSPAEPMEVGPTCHYVMGGVEVDPDTARPRGSRACSPPARSPAACTARTGSAATRCPTCWSSAGAPAPAPPSTSRAWPDARPAVDEADVDAALGDGARAVRPATPRVGGEPVHAAPGTAADDERPGRHHPPRGRDAARRSSGWQSFKARGAAGRGRGAPAVQPRLAPRPGPAQHAASSASAWPRRRWSGTESRGGHTREDYPAMDPEWRQMNLDLRARRDDRRRRSPCSEQPVPTIRARPAAAVRPRTSWRSTSPTTSWP